MCPIAPAPVYSGKRKPRITQAQLAQGMLQQEASLLLNLNSFDVPHIPTLPAMAVAGIDPRSGYVFLAMEQGAQSLRHRPLESEEELGGVVAALLETLCAAHGRNIMHNDLKLDNIVVRRRRGDALPVMLVDWALARSWRGPSGDLRIRHDTGPPEGTTSTISVSVLRGDAVGPRDDVEALLWTMWAWVCGGSLPWDDIRAYGELREYRLEHDSCMSTLDLLSEDVDAPLATPELATRFDEAMALLRGMEPNLKPPYARVSQMFTR